MGHAQCQFQPYAASHGRPREDLVGDDSKYRCAHTMHANALQGKYAANDAARLRWIALAEAKTGAGFCNVTHILQKSVIILRSATHNLVPF